MRIWAKFPAGKRITYMEGDVGPQCEHSPRPPCGHRYGGGGAQYYIPKPELLNITKEECTTSAEGDTTAWEACGE